MISLVKTAAGTSPASKSMSPVRKECPTKHEIQRLVLKVLALHSKPCLKQDGSEFNVSHVSF